MLKPVYATLRRKEHLNVGYIDDSYLQGDTVSECNDNITDTIDLFTRLGFIIHPIKSVLQPTQLLVFLGFVLNSVNTTATLTPEKINRIYDKCFELRSEVNMTIHDLAEVIGLLVSSFPRVLYGPLFYRHLENDKTTALRESKGNYSAYMTLSVESLQELRWWCDNIENVDYKICIPNSKIDITLYTDASNDGWGAVMGTSKTGGKWNEAEASHHINYLELMAIFLA